MSAMRVDGLFQLDDDQSHAVLSLARRATTADGVTPLSEHVLLHVRHSSGGSVDDPLSHFLLYDGTQLAGYAHLEHGSGGEPATAEVVIDPDLRRGGAGRTLVQALLKQAPDLRLWSHGHLAAARAFAARDGFTSVRELWRMKRPLGPEVGADPLPEPHLPEGFTARTFVEDQDEDVWLRVNARAFAHHPEQGRITRADLDQRFAEDWFDPDGFILVEDPHGRLAAFHWTKVHAHAATPGNGQPSHPPIGEVYVVGVDPDYQGQGLGTAVTLLGLRHRESLGLAEVMLYVDGDNAAAIATYTRLGFQRADVDVMYSRAASGEPAA
ncbi:MAG: mycothiol synthase [Oryzihumus sp.]